jgi:hypothetical protein
MKGDLSKQWSKFIDSTFENINGICVQKGINSLTGEEGYKWGDNWYSTIEEVKDEMNGFCSIINMSIVNPDGSETRLKKEHTDKFKEGKSPYKSYKKDMK